MPMKILSGTEVSKHLKEGLKASSLSLKAQLGRPPGLAVVLVGDDPASQVYVKNKIKTCHELGIESFEHRLKESATPEELKKCVGALNHDPKVDGILVQLPLPKQFIESEVVDWIRPDKDPDALTTHNVGLLWKGRAICLPCTPSGVMEILNFYKIPVEGKKAVVVGRSQIVGLPMAQLLLAANATVEICHSKTKDLRSALKDADIVVVAAGRPEFLGKEDFKKDAVVIDVGIHRKPAKDGTQKLCGDVRFEELKDWAQAATPVPGGVGPMTIAILMQNTLKLAASRVPQK